MTTRLWKLRLNSVGSSLRRSADHLYQVEIFYCILLEGARSKTGVSAALGQLFRDPAGAFGELKAQFTNDNMKTLLRTHIERDVARLDQRVQAFPGCAT